MEEIGTLLVVGLVIVTFPIGVPLIILLLASKERDG